MRRRRILGFAARYVAAWRIPDSSTANQARIEKTHSWRSQAGKLRVSSMKNRRCILESCYRLRHTLKMQTAGSFIQKCHPSVSLPGNRGLSAPAPPLPEAVSSDLQTMTNYQQYIQSEQWQSIRRRKLTQCAYRCEHCGDNDTLNVHHLTYARVYREELEDLMVLCYRCHASVEAIIECYRRHDDFTADREKTISLLQRCDRHPIYRKWKLLRYNRTRKDPRIYKLLRAILLPDNFVDEFRRVDRICMRDFGWDSEEERLQELLNPELYHSMYF